MRERGEETGEGRIDGAQAIRRAAALMRCIGRAGARGASLAAIVGELQLARSTAHRILKCLVEEGLVRHDVERRRYVIGRLTYELGLAATMESLELMRWRDVVERVASRTGATSYLMARSGLEAVCIFKSEGSSAIRVIPVHVGERRFLGVGAGACALLAALEPAVSDEVLRDSRRHLADYPNLTPEVVRAIVEEARRTGFAVSRNNVVNGALGIGMAIPAESGAPFLALSIAALAAGATEETIGRWRRIIRQEVHAAMRA